MVDVIHDIIACMLSHSVVSDSATLWTVVHQAPLPIRFFQQEYWSGLPYPSPEDIPVPGIIPASLVSPASAGGFFTSVPPGKHPYYTVSQHNVLSAHDQYYEEEQS